MDLTQTFLTNQSALCQQSKTYHKHKFAYDIESRAMVGVAQLAKLLLSTHEVHRSNPVLGNLDMKPTEATPYQVPQTKYSQVQFIHKDMSDDERPL